LDAVSAATQPVVLVSSGGHVAGRQIAEDLAARGWHVALNYPAGRRDHEAFVESLRARGGHAIGLFARLEEEGTGAVLVRRTLAEFGRLDHLVVDPPVAPATALRDLDDEELTASVQTSVLGVPRLVRAASGALIAGRGRMVVVARAGGSAGALVAGALVTWAAAVGDELDPLGVAVACVAAGLPGARAAEGAIGEDGVARAVIQLLDGRHPAPGARMDVALSSRP
jgi:NAD(P)-dependent dehydrogenase (short-subunit alcohol dehydrogenase family)